MDLQNLNISSRFFAGLQWMLQIPGATSYMGCIGKDKYGQEMTKNSKSAGVNVLIFLLLLGLEFLNFISYKS